MLLHTPPAVLVHVQLCLAIRAFRTRATVTHTRALAGVTLPEYFLKKRKGYLLLYLIATSTTRKMMIAVTALLCGVLGGEVALFPPGQVPGEVPGAVGPEYWDNRTTGSGYVLRLKKNVTAPTLTPFLVTNCPASGCAAVVVAPGGAYMQLAFNMEGTDVAERFNAMGISAFVLKYRVPQRPAQPGVAGRETFGWAPLQDAQRALGVVRGRAAEWNIDPTKVGFNGFSAGGHLTVHIATAWGTRTYPRVDAADDLPCRPDFALPICTWLLAWSPDLWASG